MLDKDLGWEADLLRDVPDVPLRYFAKTPMKRPDRKRNVSNHAKHLISTRRLRSRDYKILAALYSSVHLLSRHQIQRLFWKNPHKKYTSDNTANRLKQLYEMHVVNYNPTLMVLMATVNIKPCYAYYMNAVGVELLAQAHNIDRRTMREPRSYDLHKGMTMATHDLMVSEVYTRLTTSGKHNSDVVKKTVWVNETAIANKLHYGGRELIRPDGYFYVEMESGEKHHYFLELDRQGDKAMWDDKISKYDRLKVLHPTVWKRVLHTNIFPTVLTVTIHSINPILTHFEKSKPASQWLFQSWDDLIQSDNLRFGWLNPNDFGRESHIW